MNRMIKFIRGSVWLCDFGKEVKGDCTISGKRPCIVVSNANINTANGLITVVPVTTAVKEYPYGFSIGSILADDDSYVLAPQITTVSKKSMLKFYGILDDDVLKKVDTELSMLFNIIPLTPEYIQGLVKNTPKSVKESATTNIEEDVEKPTVKIITEWNETECVEYLDWYETYGWEDAMRLYNLTNKKAAQQRAYVCRKKLGKEKHYERKAI